MMTKYLRQKPENIHRAPPHHNFKYIYGLDISTPTTLEQFIDIWRIQETQHDRMVWDEARRETIVKALEWLVENGLAITIDNE